MDSQESVLEMNSGLEATRFKSKIFMDFKEV